MYSQLIDAFIVLCFMTGVFFAFYYMHKARVKERLLLIEKGVDISDLPKIGIFNFKFPWLKVGIVITCAAFGVVLGGFLEALQLIEKHDIKAPTPMLLRGGMLPMFCLYLFGGIGMILAFFIDKPKAQK